MLGLAAVLGLGGAALKYDQDARNQERREDKRVAALRMDSVDALFKGRDALAQKNWTDGQLILSKLLTKIEAEPRLADLRAAPPTRWTRSTAASPTSTRGKRIAPGIANSFCGGMRPSSMRRNSPVWICPAIGS